MNRLYLTLIPILSSFLFLPTACAFSTHPTSSQRNSVVLANQLSETQILAVSPPESTKPRQVSNSPTPTGLVNKIDRIAQQITVKINARNPTNGNGSGVIIAHQGNTYYVLTAFHVVENQDEYKIVTPDKQQYLVQEKNIVKEKGLDVAILQFSV